MKKYIFTLLLLLACQLTYGQSLDSLFDEFGKAPNAECVRISPFLMSVGRLFAENEEGSEIVKKIKSMRVLDLEDCPAEVKERFGQQVKKADTGDYEELMRINDNGDKTTIYLKRGKNEKKEFVLLNDEKDEFNIIVISGDLTLQEIQQIIQKE